LIHQKGLLRTPWRPLAAESFPPLSSTDDTSHLCSELVFGRLCGNFTFSSCLLPCTPRFFSALLVSDGEYTCVGAMPLSRLVLNYLRKFKLHSGLCQSRGVKQNKLPKTSTWKNKQKNKKTETSN
jgi:hypothetical protein